MSVSVVQTELTNRVTYHIGGPFVQKRYTNTSNLRIILVVSYME
jgi:hypothetical protein